MNSPKIRNSKAHDYRMEIYWNDYNWLSTNRLRQLFIGIPTQRTKSLHSADGLAMPFVVERISA